MSGYVPGKDLLVSGGEGQTPVVTFPITEHMRELLEEDSGLLAIGYMIKAAYDWFMQYAATKTNG